MAKRRHNKRKESTHAPVAAKAAARIVRMAFDSAQTNRNNQNHWAKADDLSADAAANPSVRKELRKRSRYEVANNSYARGIILTVANDTIGTGPRLQMMTTDDVVNSIIERDFYAWCVATSFFEKLRTVRVSKAQDGESFAIMTTNPGSLFPVKLDIQLIEAEQITSDETKKGASSLTDGINLDAYGNPVSYSFLTVHPGDGTKSKALYTTIPASAMIHYFRVDRPGQHRGLPEILPALDLFGQMREYTTSVLLAARTAASLSAIMHTMNSANIETAIPEDHFGSLTMEPNTMLTIPEGWDITQLKSEQPTTTYKEFKGEILNEIARCMNIPFNVAAGNSSGYNYASGRMDWQTYYKSIRVDQSEIEARILDRIFQSWLMEYRMISEVNINPEMRMDHQWFWDGMEHVDPKKEADAQTIRLGNLTTSLSIECAKQGLDWEENLTQIAREKELMKKLGLAQADVTQPNAQSDEEENEEEDQNDEQD